MDACDRRCAVLVVHDTSEKITQLMATLSNDYEVKLVRCGQQVLEEIRNTPDGSILLDVLVPDTDGVVDCRSLEPGGVPAVFMPDLQPSVTQIRHELTNANHAILLGMGLLSHYWDDIVSHMDEVLDDEYAGLAFCNDVHWETRKNAPTVISGILASARRIEAILAGLRCDGVEPEKESAVE